MEYVSRTKEKQIEDIKFGLREIVTGVFNFLNDKLIHQKKRREKSFLIRETETTYFSVT